jgi:hypothetical protein
LPLAERLALLSTIGNATDSRDKCLEKLGLNMKPDNDPWKILDRQSREPAPTAAQSAASSDATPQDGDLDHTGAERSSEAPTAFNRKTQCGVQSANGDAAGQPGGAGTIAPPIGDEYARDMFGLAGGNIGENKP